MDKVFQYYVDLVSVLTQKELKAKYKNGFLGYLWSLANPLIFAGIFFLIFKGILKIEIENYFLFLLTGLFPWQWFSNSVNASSLAFIRSTSLLKKVPFSMNFLPLATGLSDMIHFILCLPFILILAWLCGKPLYVSQVYGIPLLLLIQFSLIYGLCLFVSTLTLYFRDMERLIPLMMTFLFYLTPVFYSETQIPPDFRYLLYLNPLALLMMNWRNILLEGVLLPQFLLASAAYSVFLLLAGQVFYRKLSYRFAEIV